MPQEPLLTGTQPGMDQQGGAAEVQGDAGLQSRYSAWQEYLKRPDVTAGLAQFGISLLNPSPIKGTGFGQAVGQGVAAMGRQQVQTQALRDQEAEVARSEQEREFQRQATTRELDIRQQNADTARQGLNRGGGGGGTAPAAGPDTARIEAWANFLDPVGEWSPAKRAQYGTVAARLEALNRLTPQYMAQIGVQSELELIELVLAGGISGGNATPPVVADAGVTPPSNLATGRPNTAPPRELEQPSNVAPQFSSVGEPPKGTRERALWEQTREEAIAQIGGPNLQRETREKWAARVDALHQQLYQQKLQAR